mmetsp:Transcript_24785/g.25124  ORF Transcript_24785/g.25124 Transcript_24785/m.25124 type:complete len:244 (+) Transcript_24785:88-819(+)
MLASAAVKKCCRLFLPSHDSMIFASALATHIPVHYSSRNFTQSIAVSDDLPYHIVVGMPALSPTMETGILSEWYVEEGAGFSAGEALAKIETDKASIDYEAQDDGFIAKILMDADSGKDIEVGIPIMVTVEEAEEVAAFSDFVAENSAAPPTEPAAAPEPIATATPEPPKATLTTTSEPVTAAASAPVEIFPPEMEFIAEAVAPILSTGWGEFAKINSPLLKTLSKQQYDYVEKYGTTGQVPL